MGWGFCASRDAQNVSIHGACGTTRIVIPSDRVHRRGPEWSFRAGGAPSRELCEGKRVRKRTIANLGQLPPALIDGLRVLLQGGAVVGRPGEALEIRRSLPHGHVAAVIAMMAQ